MLCRFDASTRRGSIHRNSIRGLVAIAWCALAMPALPPQPASAQQFDYDPEGYWKMPSPPATKGEFDGEDPIGLASRKHIPTDCAIHWKDEGGKTYCFASAMSSQLFQDERTSILPKAVAFWANEHPQKPGASKDAKPGTTPLASEPAPRPR